MNHEQKKEFLRAVILPTTALGCVLINAIESELSFDDAANEDWCDTLIAAVAELMEGDEVKKAREELLNRRRLWGLGA
jgi:hypothetical protein